VTGFAVWSLVAGYLLRSAHPRLGLGLVIIGVAAALDVVGSATGLRALGELGLFVYLFAFPVFSVAIGVTLLRAADSATS